MLGRRLGLVMLGGVVGLSFLSGGVAGAISDDQKGVISQNCGTIRQSLKQLQYADSRTRIYLGSAYEVAISDFMTPLGVRLEKNGLDAEKLNSLKSDFVTARRDFVTTFTNYQKSLEELAAWNCQADPEGFYNKLSGTRQQRANLNQITVQMRALLTKHVQTVIDLKETYGAEK